MEIMVEERSSLRMRVKVHWPVLRRERISLTVGRWEGSMRQNSMMISLIRSVMRLGGMGSSG